VNEGLIRYFGRENEWFAKLLLLIHELKVKRHFPITDILIREDEYIYFASIKAFQPLPYLDTDGKPFKPTREDLLRVLVTLGKEFEVLELKYDYEGIKERLNRKESVDFSFAIKGLGIYRCNVSFSENLFSPDGRSLGMSIRILDLQVPDIEAVFYPPSYRKLIAEGEKRPISLIEEYKNAFYGLVGKQAIRKPELRNGEWQETIIEKKVVRTGGLILHVGPTSSGKTTAIASEIAYLAREATGVIITYENPIEYRFVGFPAPIRQYELGTHLKEDPRVILRHLLRVNPSVVLYGEARTPEEIRMVIEVANRGHLIFSTIHANNVKEALGILLSVCQDEPYLLANGLIMIVAHRLILNEQGEIVPIIEVWSPDKVDRASLAKGDLKEIYRRFYQERVKTEGARWTFKQYLEELLRVGIIDKNLKNHLLTNAPLVFDPA